MSEKKNSGEKLSEIDSHVTKHYNIIKRLGKGVIIIFFFKSKLIYNQ